MNLTHAYLLSPHSEYSEEQQMNFITGQLLFALVWSLGGNTDDEGRKRFDSSLRCIMIAVLLSWQPVKTVHYFTKMPLTHVCLCDCILNNTV